MGRTYWLAVLLLAAAGPAAGRAQTTVDWELDEATFVDVRHVARQEVTVLERTKVTDTTIRFLFKVRPVKVGRAGTVLDGTVVACEDESLATGGEVEKGTFKGYKDQKFRLTLGADHRTFELGGIDGLAVAVFGDDAKTGTAAEKKFAADMAEAVLRYHLADVFVPLPGKAVGVGDKWRNKAEITLHPLARITMDREYTLAGHQVHDGRRVETVNWASPLECTPLVDDQGVFPFKVKEMKAVGKSRNEGTALWDAIARRPVRIDSLQVYDLDMTMEIDGKAVKAAGKGTDSFVVRFLAKDPDAK